LLDAESRADSDDYRDALKFLGILFCSSHKTGYVSLISDFFVSDWCASDGMRTIFNKACLFRKTVNGDNIFSDRFVEWIVQDLRIYLDKFSAGKNQTSLFQQVAANLNNRALFRSIKKQDTYSEKEQAQIRLSKVYCETLVMCDDLNLWGPGPLREVPAKCYVDRKSTLQEGAQYPEAKKGSAFSFCGTKEYNMESCFIFSTGLERWGEYFEFFLGEDADLNNPARPEQDNKGVKLSMINPEVNARDDFYDKEKERCTSLDAEALGEKGVGLYTAKELKAEIDTLNGMLGNAGLAKVSKGKKKQDHADNVVKARERLLAHDPEWATKRLANLKEEYEAGTIGDAANFQQRLDAEANQTFLSLKGTDIRDGVGSKKYRISRHRAPSQNPVPLREPRPERESLRSEVTASSASTRDFSTQGLDSTPQF
jgi:hypothetical protein